MKKKTTMTVLDSHMLAQDIWSLELAYAPEDIPDEVRPGQFAGLYPAGGEMILMRPISICRWDGTRGTLRFVYRAAGKGTRSFTSLRAGDRIDMLGILGNGYDLEKLRGKHVLLLGGGIGVPPMLELAAALQGTADSGTKVTAVMGYRNSGLFLKDFSSKTRWKSSQMFTQPQRTEVPEQRAMSWMRCGKIKFRQMSSVPADRFPCFAPSSVMRRRRTFRLISLWRSGWPAA